MEGREVLVYGAATPLTAVDRFLESQKNDALCSKKQERPLIHDNKENVMMFGRKTMEGHVSAKALTTCKGTKKGDYKNLVKGQWTPEEDRKLIRLVRQHGERKWAVIAEKLEGRAGKQCRERWHNHLRPDIKKECWSEEEERVLVEAHSRMGNKWAEIAKLIAGRSENSIKNHWNATRRRQNTKRKHKHRQDHHSDASSPTAKRPCVLQDYIRRITNNNNIISGSIQKSPSIDHNYSAEDSASSLMGDSYDEELFFMQNLFANIGNSEEKPDHIIGQQVTESRFMASPPDHSIKNPNNSHNSSHLSSDLYLSYLLNGGSAPCSSSSNVDFGGGDFLAPQANSSSSARREMDLIEMISAGSCQGSNFCSPFFYPPTTI